MKTDLYEILGVNKNATPDEIRKSFRRLAKKYHPDVNPGNKEAEQKFKEINLAYEVLKDPAKKSQYDQMRSSPFGEAQMGGKGFSGGYGSEEDLFKNFGLGDLFEEIFGGGFGGGIHRHGGFDRVPFRQKNMKQRGSDQEAPMSVTFLEAATGGERSIALSDGRRLTIKIPPGVNTGSKIKLSGAGGKGLGGDPNGDLILTLDITPHPYFSRENENVILKLPISLSEAILGGEVSAPTLDGKVSLKIPKGISSGQRLKLPNKGILSPKTGKRGDQYCEILIKLPKELDEIYQEYALQIKKIPFNPREDFFK